MTLANTPKGATSPNTNSCIQRATSPNTVQSSVPCTVVRVPAAQTKMYHKYANTPYLIVHVVLLTIILLLLADALMMPLYTCLHA